MFSSIGQSLVSWFLKKFLDKYIEDIDTRVKDFQYGLSGGNLVLTDLNLKAEALVGLDLPIEAKAGHISLLELKLPAITRIRTDSLVVRIDNVLLLASPVCDRNYDREKDEALEKARKRETLDKLEQLLQQEQSDKEDSDQVADPGFLERMKVTILQNIQVQITDIHIRYEDDITNPGTPFAFGITLQELSLNPLESAETTSMQFYNKLLTLKELSVYWNCLLHQDDLLKNDLDDWKQEMAQSIEDTKIRGVEFEYMVEPINGSADLVINLQEKSREPLVSCTGSFHRIILNFKRHMFLNAVILQDSFAMMRVNEKYRKYHPGVPCRGNAKLWWKYAYDSVVQEVVKPKREFWTRIWDYRRLYKGYRDLYTEKFLTPGAADVAKLDKYEMELNIESIVMARKEAEKIYIERKPDMVVVKPANEGIMSRFSNWWYSDSEAENVVVHAKHAAAKDDEWWNTLDDKEREELYEAFDYSKDKAVASSSNTSYVKYWLDVKLEGVQLNLLIDTQSKSIHVVSLSIEDITGLLAVKVQGVKFTSSVKHMEVYNATDPTNVIHLANVDSLSPLTSTGSEQDRTSLLSAVVEQYPTDIDADLSIRVNTLPICLVYDHAVACSALAFFYVPVERFNISSQLKHLTPEFSTAGLQYAIESHQRIYVEATLCSPYLIIPANGKCSGNDSRLILDLGVLKVSTELRPRNVRLEDTTLEAKEKVIYDKYTLSVQDVKVIYANSSEDDWKEMRRLADSEIHLMPSINLLTTVSLSAEPDFNKLPKFKVDSSLDRLQVKLSTEKIEPLLTFVYSFPHPSAKEFFHVHKLKAMQSARVDDNAPSRPTPVMAAGMLMRSELNKEFSEILEEVDFNKIQRLEEKDIFVNQGDLMNLWMLLSKESSAKHGEKKTPPRPSNQGLNAVADLLLEPDAVRVEDYDAPDINSDGDDEFVLASDRDPCNSLDLPGLRTYAGKEFYTLLHIAFSIKEVSMKLLSGQSDYITAVIQDVTGKACKTNCGISVRIQMNSFRITDDLFLDTEGRRLHIVRSPESSSMASFEGCFIDDVTKVTFTNITAAIMFNVSTILLSVHDGSTRRILEVVNKVNRVLTVLQKTNEPRGGPAVIPRSSTVDSVSSLPAAPPDRGDVFYDAVSKFDTESLISRRLTASKESLGSPASMSTKRSILRRQKSKRDPSAEVIECDIKCSLKSLEVHLQRGHDIIAVLDVSDVTAQYEKKKALWTAEAKLGALSLTNPMASIYQQVLVVEEGLREVMTFQLTSFNQSVERNESCDQRIEVKLRRTRVIFINEFVRRLTQFIGEFSSPTAEKVQETSRQKLSSSARAAHSKGMRTLIAVEAKTPLIIVPENADSHNALLLKLGDLSVSNELLTEGVSRGAVLTQQGFDLMTVTLENIAIERIKYVNERKYLAIRNLLTPITTKLIIKRALPPVAKSTVDFSVKADMNQFTIETSQLDMQMLGKVLYENILAEDQEQQAYDVTDVGSTISSAFGSTSSSGSRGQGMVISLCLGGLTLRLKREDASTNALQSVSEDLAVMRVDELKVDFCKGKKDSSMSCKVILRKFTLEDKLATAQDEFNTNSVIELDNKANQALVIKYDLDPVGDSVLFCSVVKMRFNVNLPFVKSLLTLLQESFVTWKPVAKPQPSPNRHLSRDRNAAARRRRKVNTAALNRQVSTSAWKMSKSASDNVVSSKTTKLVVKLTFGKQSLYMITGDGSQKALVAELNISGKAEIASVGKIEADVKLSDMTVYSTSLRSEEAHLRQQCLLPCTVNVNYSSLSPLAELKDTVPPKVDINVTLTKVDIKLSTNVIYHTFDALTLFTGEDAIDDGATTGFQTDEADLNEVKELNRDQWLEQYDPNDEFQHVELNPIKAAVESLTLEEFDFDIEFSVAIGQEFVAILRTGSTLSASVKDWSTQLRAECCLSLDSDYYNELLDVWEPLIEGMYDEQTGKYDKWELLARLTTAPSHPIAKTDPSEILVNSQELDTFIHHQIASAKQQQRAIAAAAEHATRTHLDPSTADVLDHRDAQSTASSDDDNFAPTAGASRKTVRPQAACMVAPHRRARRPTPTGYRDDVIPEEPEDEHAPMLMSGGLPTLLLTQPSEEMDMVDGDVGTPSACHSIDGRGDECDAKVDDKECDQEVMCTYISLISRDKVLLNASPQGINVVTSVLDTFTKKPKDSTLFEVYKAYPLTISNLLGIPACVALHRSMKGSDIKLENMRIAESLDVSECSTSGQQTLGLDASPIEDPANQPLKTLAALTAPAGLTRAAPAAGSGKPATATLMKQQLHLAVDDYLPIPCISFRRTQSRDFSAQPRNRREECLCLRVSSQSKHGRRHVYIYSQLKVKNELQTPLQISYQEISSDGVNNRLVPTSKVLGTISSGEVINIPAMVAQHKKLQIKPITGELAGTAGEYCESNESLWWKDHLKSKAGARTTALKRISSASTHFLTCANQLQQTFTFKAVWIPRKCLADKCSGNCPSFDVLLQPTAEVKNFLPFAIRLDVHVSTTIGSQPSSYSMEPGENMQIHDSINTPRRCHLVIPEYQGTTWKGWLDIHDKMTENRMTPVTLSSELDSAAARGSMTLDPKPFANRPLTLCSHVTRVEGSRGNRGQLQISLYSSYWISNTTGINLQFRASAIGSQPIETEHPYPMLFMVSSMKKMQLRIPGYKWSKAFAVDAAGTVGSVSCVNTDCTTKHRFMVETTLSNTQLTKIITIFPLFVVLNKLEHKLMYKECVAMSANKTASPSTSGTEQADSGDGGQAMPPTLIQNTAWTTIEPEQALPFWPTSRKKPLAMMVKREGMEETTHAFPANLPQRTLMPCGETYLTADISGGLGTEYFITIRPYQLGDSVVRIENLTDHTMVFYQGDISTGNALSLESSKSWLYHWPDPMEERKLFWVIPELKSKPVLAQFTQDGYGVVKHLSHSVFWQSYGDNLQRVLTFSENETFQQIVRKKNQKEQATLFVFVAMDAVCVSLINKHSLEVAVLSVNHTPSEWQVKVDDQSHWYPLGEKLSALIEKSYCSFSDDPVTSPDHNLKIDVGQLKFIEPFSGVLRRKSFPGLKVQYQKSEFSMAVQASVNHLQIDNQLPDAFFPVVFHPTNQTFISKLESTTKPCIQMFVRRQFPVDGRADCYKPSPDLNKVVAELLKADISVQQFALRIDKGFMLTLLDYITECRKSDDTDHNKLMKTYHEDDIKYCLRDLAEDTVIKTDKSTGTKIYVEDLHISSIMIKLSFSMAGNPHLTNVENTQSTFGGDVVDFLLRSIGMTLTEVTDIEFSLGEYIVSCAVLTTDQISNDTMAFYKYQAIRQAYVFVLGLDIIGNPLGLAKDVRRGLSDFFSSADPLSTTSRKSLALGIKSAYGNIVGGLCGAGSKITESVGRGVNVLSFDKTFQKARQRRMRSQPSHFPASILLSGKTFGYAIGSGVAGIVLQPKRGVEKSGAPGFFKGVGKGVTGVFIKPVGGLFDSISVLLDGFRRVTQSGNETVGRVRLPRHCIPSEGVMRYHPYLAQGVEILNSLNAYCYSPDEVYWSHLLIEREGKHQHIILATTKSIYLLYVPWYGAQFKAHWTIPLDELRKPTLTDGVITLPRMGQADDEAEELVLDDSETLKWFHRRLNALLRYSKATYKTT